MGTIISENKEGNAASYLKSEPDENASIEDNKDKIKILDEEAKVLNKKDLVESKLDNGPKVDDKFNRETKITENSSKVELLEDKNERNEELTDQCDTQDGDKSQTDIKTKSECSIAKDNITEEKDSSIMDLEKKVSKCQMVVKDEKV